MKPIIALIILLTLMGATNAGDVLSWNDDRKTQDVTILAWEVDVGQSFIGPWTLFATVYEPQVSIERLPNGRYFARVRALGANGLAGEYCRPIAFAIPRAVPAPAPTHVKLTILRSTDGEAWQTIAEHLDPIDSHSLYKLESTLVTAPR